MPTRPKKTKGRHLRFELLQLPERRMAEAVGLSTKDKRFAALMATVDDALMLAVVARRRASRTPAETKAKLTTLAQAARAFEAALLENDARYADEALVGPGLILNDLGEPMEDFVDELRELADAAEAEAGKKIPRRRRQAEADRDEVVISIAKLFRAAYAGDRRDRDEWEEEFVRLALKAAKLPTPKTEKELRRLIDSRLR